MQIICNTTSGCCTGIRISEENYAIALPFKAGNSKATLKRKRTTSCIAAIIICTVKQCYNLYKKCKFAHVLPICTRSANLHMQCQSVQEVQICTCSANLYKKCKFAHAVPICTRSANLHMQCQSVQEVQICTCSANLYKKQLLPLVASPVMLNPVFPWKLNVFMMLSSKSS